MHNLLKKLERDARRITLSSGEKDGARRVLVSFMELHPVREGAVSRLYPQRPSFITVIASLSKRTMPIILLIALFLGGGVTFGAQSALPGDALYPVKVNVNERVRSMFAFSPEGEAVLKAKFAVERLAEAEELAARGKLGVSAETGIAKAFATEADEAHARIEFLKTKDGLAAAQLSSDFEAKLKAHEQILTSLKMRSGAAEGREHSLIVDIKAKLRIAEEHRVETESDLAGKEAPDVRAAAEGKSRAARNLITEARKAIEKRGASSETAASAEKLLGVAEQILVEGEWQFAAGEYHDAFIVFQKAERVAREALLILAAAEKLSIEVPSSLGKEVPLKEDDAEIRKEWEEKMRGKIFEKGEFENNEEEGKRGKGESGNGIDGEKSDWDASGAGTEDKFYDGRY